MYTMKISGVDDVADQLKELESVVSEKVLRRAGRKAMKTIAEEARRRAPRNMGADYDGVHLQDQIKIRAKRTSNGIKVQVYTTKKAKYAASVEFGHAGHFQRRDHMLGRPIRKPFKVRIPARKARPFMRPAFHQNLHEAIAIFKNELRVEVIKAIKRKSRTKRR